MLIPRLGPLSGTMLRMSADAAFPPSVSAVPTSVPTFVGYTAQAISQGQSVSLQPVPIDSLAAFEQIFGNGSRGTLYDSIALFYENGGASCFVVSVAADSQEITASGLIAGLSVIAEQPGVTMLVVPDAVLLPSIADFGSVVQAMLQQAGSLRDRFAILDVYGGASATSATLTDVIEAFRTSVGLEFLSYGAAYFPFLIASDGTKTLPPSGAMAGIYTKTGASGVWNTPANVEVQGISGLTYLLTNNEPEDLTSPADGKSVDPLRVFQQQAPVVWGARTLDGNSNDYRYIQVRRTLIFIEQSIKNALDQFMFAANDGQTWTTVIATITSFLTQVWTSNGLIGSTPADAFSVQCGLGSTMTSQDIENGFMNVQVMVAPVRPAEFIVLTFQQAMAEPA
jgi:Bacteriophage tail sheath protein